MGIQATASARGLKGAGFLFSGGACGGATAYGPEALSPETREMAASVRAFIEGEVVSRWDAIDAMEPGLAPSLFRQLGELGFFSMEVPESLGGLGLSLAEMLPMLEHLGRCGGFGVGVMVHQGIGMQPIVFVGTEEMCESIMPSAMAAETLCAYALTEPGYGSDALAGATTAVLDTATDEWVLNGSKQWITNASWAKYFTVFAQVEGDKFTAFLVERDTPGFEVLAEEHKLGIKGSSTCALRLQNVRVPSKNRMGGIGRGHKIALNMLNLGRLKLGTTMIGACKQLLAHSLQYTSERHQFGKPLNSFGLIRRKLAEMAALTFAGEAMAYCTASLIDAHMATHLADGAGREQKLLSADEFSIECSACKVYLTEAAGICADHAVQCYGGYGFSEEYPVARFYRDVRVSRIYEGTNEINRIHTVNTLLRRLFKGDGRLLAQFREALATSSSEPLAGLKGTLLHTLDALAKSAGEGGAVRPEQDSMGALADAVIQVFAAESAMMRAAAVTGVHAGLARDLAGLATIRAAKVVRETAITVLGAAGLGGTVDALPVFREDLEKLGATQFALERSVAAALVEGGIEWPEFESAK